MPVLQGQLHKTSQKKRDSDRLMGMYTGNTSSQTFLAYKRKERIKQQFKVTTVVNSIATGGHFIIDK